jgi:Ankyrin repeats (3 copies)/Tetratricopeptide repeat/Ankyrin repeats (many copies)
LHIESLARKHSRKDVRKALQNLPKELDDTYDEAMERICNQDDEDVQLAKKILTWITYSLRPLTVTELQHAIAVELNDNAIDEEALLDETLMVSVCAGLVAIDQESNVIRLVHYTTEEYFGRKRMDLFPTGQDSIVSTCLTYLSFDAFKAGYSYSDRQMDTRLDRNPFLQYAATYWGIHAIGEPELTVKSQILKFLCNDSNLSCSVQAMRLPSYRYRGYSQKPPKKISGLWVAAAFGLTEIVRMLTVQSFGIDITATYGETALHAAADGGHEAVVRLLIDRGTPVDAADKIGKTALNWAVDSGHEAMVRLLLEQGAGVNAKGGEYGTALQAAARHSHEAVIRLLLEEGAEVNAKGGVYGTALQAAARCGHEAVIRLLLEEGAEVNAEGGEYGTELQAAARCGHGAVIRLLLGRKYPSTLTSMANLASTYRNQGRWMEAENLDIQVMETSLRVLGEEHPSTLTSMANLASTFWNQGRDRRAGGASGRDEKEGARPGASRHADEHE